MSDDLREIITNNAPSPVLIKYPDEESPLGIKMVFSYDGKLCPKSFGWALWMRDVYVDRDGNNFGQTYSGGAGIHVRLQQWREYNGHMYYNFVSGNVGDFGQYDMKESKPTSNIDECFEEALKQFVKQIYQYANHNRIHISAMDIKIIRKHYRKLWSIICGDGIKKIDNGGDEL